METNLGETKRQIAHEYRQAKKRQDPHGVAKADRLKEDYKVAKTMSHMVCDAVNYLDQQNRQKKKEEGRYQRFRSLIEYFLFRSGSESRQLSQERTQGQREQW